MAPCPARWDSAATPSSPVSRGPPPMQDRNVARRMGRWSAAHPWRSIAAWLAFVVIALFAGSAAGTVKLTDSQQAAGESKKAIQIADDAGYRSGSGEQVLVQARSGSLDP